MWQYILTSLEQPPVQNDEYSKSFTPGGIPIPRVAPAERIWASCCLSFLLTVNLKPAQHNSTQMRQFQQAIKYTSSIHLCTNSGYNNYKKNKQDYCLSSSQHWHSFHISDNQHSIRFSLQIPRVTKNNKMILKLKEKHLVE